MIDNEQDPLHRAAAGQPSEPQRGAVGPVLRAARLKRGQPIEEVARQTRIPRRWLEALENDRLGEFPALVYARGFLKDYCDYLDLPFEDLWARIQPPSAPPPAPPAPAESASPAAHDGGEKKPSGINAPGAALLAMILAAGTAFWILRSGRTASDRFEESTPRALRPLPRSASSSVSLRARSDVWLRAVVDGDLVFEGRLPRGAVLEWKPARSVSLRASSPEALELSVDGKPRPLPEPSSGGDRLLDLQ